MPFKKHTPEELIGKLREAEIVLAQGGTTADACCRLAISEQTYYRWRKEYGGLKTDQARRMKDLEKKNARLRRAICELTLDKLILQEVARGSRKACRAQTTEPRATTTLHRSYPQGAACLGAPHLSRFGAAPIDAAQGSARGGRRAGIDRGYHCPGAAIWALWLSACDSVAAICRVACEPQAG
jgi:transposase-like protein